MTWFTLNWPWVVELAGAHLFITAAAVLLSVVIAVPIGRLAYRLPKVGGPILSAATLLFAIPALPLLILVPVVFGTPLRSNATLIIALTAYGVALLVRTAADAFGAVDARVRDAALATGESPRTVFWRVDLPLAVPVLLSGIRVMMVSTIGLVTIGALIGVPGLGSMLTDGFQRGIAGEVVTGVVSVVVLALVLDGLLLLAGRLMTPWAVAR
ncbi:glycine/betaine ABC transporter permease [Pseudoclavibacter endophyticus]|uniref:ABC transporter permease subunit n=1 Tax=Pseudoclavibacter endophyticus TaxID=1778590 RepID=A0A6H9WJ41_9MICO|nr:ABC transporter permease subunit [Pseudoclavibacter endophyticus]KAB1649263.1 ABC transporter permease subunit [Pseudoclavibacter endophyticus]GGA64015.1 glycine/betaine ABC transporter permease [Pseudoclavibacter endophyticus]